MENGKSSHDPWITMSGAMVKVPTTTLSQLLRQAFSESASDQIAARDVLTGRSYKTKEIADACSLLACEIAAQNCTRIGICLPVSVEAIIAVAACISTDCCYIPLDPCLPLERMGNIIRETGISVVVTSDALVMKADLIKGHGVTLLQVTPHKDSDDDDVTVTLAKDAIQPISETPMCIMYTSGSTGKPKGVRIMQSSVLNRLHWGWREFPFQEKEAACMRTSLSFGDSFCEILSPLLKNIPIVIMPKCILLDPARFCNVLQETRVTRITVVPSLLKAMLDNCSGLDFTGHLKLITTSGEELSPQLAERLFSQQPDFSGTLLNLYGSTEVTADVLFQAFTSLHDVTRFQSSGKLSIGVPIQNTIAILVPDSDAEDISELVISGAAVAGGYEGVVTGVGNGRFIRDPMFGWCFKTGDRVQVARFKGVDQDCIIYHGRNDTQVKVNGQRFDLTEVYRVFVSEFNINPVVLFHKVTSRVLAFLLHDDFVIMNNNRSQLREHLPTYALPLLVDIGHGDFPVNAATGKIDRHQLMAIFDRQCTLLEKSRRKDELYSWFRQQKESLISDEKTIVYLTLFSAMDQAAGLFYVPSCMHDLKQDSFTSIGGSSLSVIAVVNWLRKAGINISVQDFISSANFHDLVEIMCLMNENRIAIDDHAGSLSRNLLSDLIFEPLSIQDFDQVSEFLVINYMKGMPTYIHLCQLRSQQELMKAYISLLKPRFSAAILSGASFKVLRKSDTGDNSEYHLIAVNLAESLDIDAFNESIKSPENGGYHQHCPELAVYYRCADFLAQPHILELAKQNTRILKPTGTAIDLDCIRGVHQRVLLVLEMERRTIDLASSGGYEAIVSLNANPVTQDAADLLGYKTVAKTLMRRFVDPVTRSFPFPEASASVVFKVQIKDLL